MCWSKPARAGFLPPPVVRGEAACGYYSLLRESLGKKLRRISGRRSALPSALWSSDKTAHNRMPVVVAQAGDAAPSRVVGALQDLVGGYLDALALDGDPIAAIAIRLVVGRFTISRR
jgi:hypothetical protein